MKTRLTLLFILLSHFIFAQLTIYGVVKNEEGKPVSEANVTISINNSDETLAYFITKSDGKYSLTIDNPSNETFEVKVRAMNYAFTSDLVNESSKNFDFTLQAKAIELKEVKLKESPIRKKGDTIAYDVSNFKDIKDRSIADVIKKMPGIEIENSGRILYQGEPINKYYIEGMDLLGGKYALANENLSADAVDKVQILENHQPIKMLDSLVYSSKAALNIKLKSKVTYSGKAEVGLGASPLLYQANITPMLFTKKQQMIGSYQGNNNGNDVSRLLNTLSFEDFMNESQKFSNENWLSISSVQTPNFSNERWLDNSVNMGTWNHLFKLKKELDFRLNVSYLNDYQNRLGESFTQYFLPSGDLVLNEKKQNYLQIESLNIKSTLLRNSSSNYLENVTDFKGDWNSSRGNLYQNNQFIRQQLSQPNREFSNNFKIIKKIGEQFITFRSLVSYKDYTENLRVTPGVFQNLIHQGTDYNEAYQEVNFNKFSTDHFAEFSKGIKQFVLQSKLGFKYINHNMKSDLFADEVSADAIFHNDTRWSTFNPYFENTFSYNKNKVKASFGFPFQWYSLANKVDETKRNYNRFYIEPKFNATIDFAKFWKVSTSHKFSNDLGSLTRLHEGFILYRYNSIQQNSGEFNEVKKWNSSLRFEYKNPIKSLFFNFGYTYNWNENNLLYNYKYNADASTILEVINQKNHQITHSFNGKISQYFSKINSTFNLSTTYNITKYDQLLNDKLSSINNNILTNNFDVSFRLIKWVTLEYDYLVMNYKNQLDQEKKRSITNQTHQIVLHFFPADRHYIKMNLDFYVNDDPRLNPNSTFGDLMYRYSLKKKKIDFELSAYNLFNEKYFSQNSFSSNYEQRFVYKLRPTQVMLTTRFNF
ncbi:carboxypeptidase regulatory-like domain-containing protein [Empedobacter falsenii]|uniref:carboxypeptidase-like regulatory domain-containing protein n=1 Tax=Empedobacter falsenii TaxID=343874 RepID=UPI002574EE21|nr:carboxypeptidase-like regulatory domain-containing protein [Empedobacter falsenii]MDM1299673.1 carboxypeptidase regulatory-like domain-containing protein [Empedobacter falsenii]MDM1319466.1 carboxypeptidase regulatory-like domain-containing protein [Empedobacter falsenii]